MAKQEIIEYDNGATLIHQRQNSFNGYSFVIGFSGGAQLDGKHLGLSHLVEHMLFRSTSEDLTKNILDNMLKYSINQGAFTTQDSIYITFSAVEKNVCLALDNIIKAITNTQFSQDQINKEIQVIKQEINLHIDKLKDYTPDVIDRFMQGISTDEIPKKNELNMLGSVRTLNKITPEILTKYMDRYFNLDNLVVSVTSNKPIEKVEELLNEHLFSKIPRAKDPKYIIDYPIPQTYKPINMLLAVPNPKKSNIEINLLFRERSTYSKDINKEYAYNVIEEYIMNPIGGLLFNQLRVKNNQVYSYGLYNMDLGNIKFKNFTFVTSKDKLNDTISKTCKFIKEIGEEGFPRDKFESVKNAIVDQNNAVLQKFKNCSAYNNYRTLFEDLDFIDYKEVMKNIQNITYEEFNDYITQIYRLANVSLLVEGNFDSRKLYNLIEVEEMLGNKSHSQVKDSLNIPRAEATSLQEPTTNIIVEQPAPINAEQNYIYSVDIDDNEM